MSTTPIEAILNAQVNLETLGRIMPSLKANPIYRMAMEQLSGGLEHIKDDVVHDGESWIPRAEKED